MAACEAGPDALIPHLLKVLKLLQLFEWFEQILLKLGLDTTSGVYDLDHQLVSIFRHLHQYQYVARRKVIFDSILEHIKHRQLKALPISLQNIIFQTFIFYNVNINLPIFEDQTERVDDLLDAIFLLA